MRWSFLPLKTTYYKLGYGCPYYYYLVKCPHLCAGRILGLQAESPWRVDRLNLQIDGRSEIIANSHIRSIVAH